jgi:uncharacterized protein (TIGR03790 family)
MRILLAALLGWSTFPVSLQAISPPAQVLVVVNRQSAVSQKIGAYYLRKRSIPLQNLVTLNVAPDEQITRADYQAKVEKPIAEYLRKHQLGEQILYIATTLGVPLKIVGGPDGIETDAASVDSELTMLYARQRGATIALPGSVRNPFFGHTGEPFDHAHFAIYLVTRLAAYDFATVQRMIDRSLAARNTGKIVIDVRADNNTEGNTWLRKAADQIPKERLVLDDSAKVITGEKNVIAYAGWGSNDPDRTQRKLSFEWLPGAIVTEFVSTNGRTFARPPATWTLGTWKDPSTWFAGAPQTLAADYLEEGATGASGHVYEPYLHLTPRPDILIPQYLRGRNLAESYYLAIPAVSWQNVVLGDPLCVLRP